MKTSPEAIAIACFTFVVALLIGGWQQVALLVHGLLGGVLPNAGRFDAVFASLVVLVTAVGASVLARNAAEATSQPWAGALGGAATLLALLIVLAAIAHMATAVLGRGYPLWGGITG